MLYLSLYVFVPVVIVAGLISLRAVWRFVKAIYRDNQESSASD